MVTVRDGFSGRNFVRRGRFDLCGGSGNNKQFQEIRRNAMATKQVSCDNCNGTGQADKHDYIGFAEHEVTKVKCPRCNGTGKKEVAVDETAKTDE
ncbi:MAG: hypothetical protein JRN15_04885 [Nitrososphaerota archaeon]|nr:hypothetical protein [Nitrososphaerota archaeon]